MSSKKSTPKKETPKKEESETKEDSEKPKSKTDEDRHMYQLAEQDGNSPVLYIHVTKFGPTLLVGFRLFNKKGNFVTQTKTGISITADQWKKLTDQISDIDKAVEKLNTDDEPPPSKKKKTDESDDEDETSEEVSFTLSKNRFLKVKRDDGDVVVDIREYSKDGEDWTPTDKGMSLSVDQWEKTKCFQAKVDRDVAALK